jgi:hypothetical protein
MGEFAAEGPGRGQASGGYSTYRVDENGALPSGAEARRHLPALAAGNEAVWESVLRETEEASTADSSPLRPAEREALLAVAKQYAGQSLAIEPIAAAMVQAVILPQLPGDPDAAKFWQELFVQIAENQFEDPAARSRLEAVWAWLQTERGLQQDSAPPGNSL